MVSGQKLVIQILHQDTALTLVAQLLETETLRLVEEQGLPKEHKWSPLALVMAHLYLQQNKD
jgi:uncharacterized membrane protein (DUF2068 family)